MPPPPAPSGHAQHMHAQNLPGRLPAQANGHPPAPHQRGHTQPPPNYRQPPNQSPSASAPAQPAAAKILPAINPLQPPERGKRAETDAPRRRAGPEAAPLPAEEPVETRRRLHPARVAVKYVTLPMIVVAGLWYTVQNPTTVHAALAQLPEPLPRIALAGMEIVLVNTAPTRDGLRMITTGDPRSRKADKLQVRREASR